MRLLDLWVGQFRNLVDFSVKFEENEDIAVLVGRNGSAKSNLIEALIRIFRHLDLGKEPDFAYRITYLTRRHLVEIHADPGAKQKTKVLVDGKLRAIRSLRAPDDVLPRFVFGYYSGTSDRMKSLFYDHEKKYNEDALNGRATALRPLILARPIHSQLVLLAFYLKPDEEVTNFLRDVLRIESLDSVLLKLAKPQWAKTSAHYSDFWGARGPVLTLFERIRSLSLAPMNLLEQERVSFSRTAKSENLYLYLAGAEAVQSLTGLYPDARGFFEALETMFLGEILSEVRIRVKVRGVDGTVTFRELSEGEQQLLTVLGLMRFTRNEESLYLLDEPDTHLNPAWGLYYMKYLRDIGEADKDSHTILATHDPVLVAGLTRQQIRVLYRSFKDGRVRAVIPEEDPRGRGIAAVLTSELYGLESQLDISTLDTLKEIYRLSEAVNPTHEESSALESLRASIPSLVPEEYEPDPFKNIASMAYEEAEKPLGDDESKDLEWRREAINRLRDRLVAEATGQ